MGMTTNKSFYLPFLLSLSQLIVIIITLLNLHPIFVNALNIGIPEAEKCSRTCESQNCGVAPLLRYGKYCGVLYSGCPEEQPCDGLDNCCMRHDACVKANNNDYLNTVCSQNFLRCVNKFKRRRRMPFKGNTCSIDQVTNVMTTAINFALIAGRFVSKT
ncbi:hypothetical protein RHMOL_Rhmol01G0296800 [Rhododendron molle]|uniref:Uncharacterized protein n=1 Tax=Rhododendron molle TaxID=49168 RepID=A0ACC0Q7E8_RHOML|nr:hypothetical protein RHMOL_Rhmol01G0296800 [Rhododendron molle]